MMRKLFRKILFFFGLGRGKEAVVEEVVVVENNYRGRVYSNRGEVYDIVGRYESHKDMAYHISEIIDSSNTFTAMGVDRRMLVLKSKDVLFVEVDEEIYEGEGFENES